MRGIFALAGELVPCAVEIGAIAIGIGDPHHDRGMIGHVAEPRLGLAQRGVTCATGGDVAGLDDRPDGLLILVEKRARGEPDRVEAAIRPDEQLFAVHLRPFGECPIDRAFFQRIM